MLDQELKDRWLAALRSGEYKQCGGQLSLKDDEGTRYCCLGVLADLVDPAGKSWSGYLGTLVDARGALAATLSVDQNFRCTAWNDNENLTFEQIADKIEAGELEAI